MGMFRNLILTLGGAFMLGSSLSPIPIRQAEFRDCYTPKVTSNIAIAKGDINKVPGGFFIETDSPDKHRDDKGIREIQKALEYFPDPLQKRVNEYGGQVILVDDLGSVSNFYNTMYREGESVRGFIAGDRKTAIVPRRSITRKDHIHVALHEYGHLIDHATGSPSNAEEFVGVAKVSNKRDAVRGMIYKESANEYFADMFAQYLENSAVMRKEYPEAFKYFESLVENYEKECPTRHLKGHQLMHKPIDRAIHWLYYEAPR